MKKVYKVGFVFFADGSVVNKIAAWRLYIQIYRSGIATAIGRYNISKITHKLTPGDKNFISKHKNNRGYGYWLWKPLVIIDFAEKNKKLDFVVYLDVGCEFNSNKNSIKTLSNYLNKAKYNGFVAFSTEIEKYWTKLSLIKYMGLKKELLDSPQIQTGIIVFETKIIKEICKEWVDIMRYDDYTLLIDVPKEELNREIKGFKEHRHDQSIFSALAKKNYLGQIYNNIDETYFPRNWEKKLDKPFFAARNLRFTSILNNGHFSFLYIIENFAFILFNYFRKFIRIKK